MRQDTLQNRISDGKGLDSSEIDQLVGVLGSRCSEHTKRKLHFALRCVPNIQAYGIYGRVMLNPVSYCAGQSYPDEIRTVRGLLIKG